MLSACMSLTMPISTIQAAQEEELDGITTFVFDADQVTVREGSSTNYEVVVYTSADDDTTYSPVTGEDDSGNTVYSLPEGISEDVKAELQVAIKKKGGSYAFEGSGFGDITVKKEATQDSILYLDGLTLQSRFTAALSVKKDGTAKCEIVVCEDTINTLADTSYNSDEDYPENLAGEKAAVKFKDGSDVTIRGRGTLNIKGNNKNALKSSGLLTIDGDVTLNLDAQDNGISSEKSIVINDGSFYIKARGGDGIKACADDSQTGDITINGGSFLIDSYADAVQAMDSLTIIGGNFAITTYGGYNASYNKNSDAYPSAKGLKASGSYTDANGNEVDSENSQLLITGGLFSLNCADDAVHCDGDVTIEGGTFYIQTGDDGVHADEDLRLGVSGANNNTLKITVANSYEGLEGYDVYINSGTYRVTSSDDGINAAGGSSSGSEGGGWNDRPGGPSGGSNDHNITLNSLFHTH